MKKKKEEKRYKAMKLEAATVWEEINQFLSSTLVFFFSNPKKPPLIF